jgi:hypothetical protein
VEKFLVLVHAPISFCSGGAYAGPSRNLGLGGRVSGWSFKKTHHTAIIPMFFFISDLRDNGFLQSKRIMSVLFRAALSIPSPPKKPLLARGFRKYTVWIKDVSNQNHSPPGRK